MEWPVSRMRCDMGHLFDQNRGHLLYVLYIDMLCLYLQHYASAGPSTPGQLEQVSPLKAGGQKNTTQIQASGTNTA